MGTVPGTVPGAIRNVVLSPVSGANLGATSRASRSEIGVPNATATGKSTRCAIGRASAEATWQPSCGASCGSTRGPVPGAVCRPSRQGVVQTGPATPTTGAPTALTLLRLLVYSQPLRLEASPSLGRGTRAGFWAGLSSGGRPLFSRQQHSLRRHYDQDSEEAGAISGNQPF